MKGYWVINKNTYEIDGRTIPKGRMNFHTSTRPVINSDWIKATEEEIRTKQLYKGNYFNLKFV